MSLQDWMSTPLETVRGECSIRQAARRMIDASVGALVITDSEGGKPLGMVTDRDLVLMLAEGYEPEQPVDSIVRPTPATVGQDADLQAATRKMHECGVRRLPVVDGGGRLVGMLSLDDVLVALAEGGAEAGAVLDEIRGALRIGQLHERVIKTRVRRLKR